MVVVTVVVTVGAGASEPETMSGAVVIVLATLAIVVAGVRAIHMPRKPHKSRCSGAREDCNMYVLMMSQRTQRPYLRVQKNGD